MKKALSCLLLFATAALAGCSKQPRMEHAMSKIEAGCETIGDASDKPMEDFHDNEQGVIYF